ncbi:MAG: LysM peptidoglycan-binding domain-containing protein, partial [Anaerolineaceae bacterium]|nr:LysM peptidoglycan-binding domain-containing protein [Anaerolineaceae bacterium]
MMSKQETILLGFFLALLFLCVAMGGFLLFRQWSSFESSIDYSSTLVNILTQESAKDDVAIRVALELAKLTPQPVLGEEMPVPLGKTLEPTLIVSPLEGYQRYLTQQGDTLKAIEKRFQTQKEKIISYSTYQEEGILPIGTFLWIPENNVSQDSMIRLLPDSAIVNGPLDAGFDLAGFVNGADGFLKSYQEEVRGEWMTGVEIVERVSLEHSISPKLLLTVLEFQSGWVL